MTRATLLLIVVFTACRGSAPAPSHVAAAVDAAPPAGAIPPGWMYPATHEAVSAPHAMVVTDAPLATKIGVDVLKAGGSAADAAVAVAFALAVVYPEAGNLGGGGFAVTYEAGGTAAALDFRETAPGKAMRDMYLDAKGQPIPDASTEGPLAAGVPGTVAGLWALHEKYGVKPWKELLAPAIALARDGFDVDEHLETTLAINAKRLAPYPASAALFLPGGKPLAKGTHWKNPELAATLERIAADGPKGFYQGATADAIVAEMARAPGTMAKGIISVQDLAGYQARWREPTRFTYRGRQVISMPLPSSGGFVLAVIGALLDGYDLGKLGFHTPDELHVTAEAFRRAYAERNAALGDPDFVKVPVDKLLAKDRLEKLRGTIDLAKATPSDSVVAAAVEGQNTTHFAVVDEKGDVVALTYTLNALYGGGVTVTGAGFLLNDEMDDFTIAAHKPNSYELVQGEANTIAPGKRMLSSMAPTIVLDADGKRAAIVLGARGGSRIPTAVWQELSNVVDFGQDVEAAVKAPRIHHQHQPDTLFYEQGGLGPAQLEALGKKGHTLKITPLPAAPVANAPVMLRAADGGWTADPDPRRGGLAAGY